MKILKKYNKIISFKFKKIKQFKYAIYKKFTQMEKKQYKI